MPPPHFDCIDAARIALRRFSDADLAAFVAYRADPEVARYQSWSDYDEPRGRALIEDMRSLQPGEPGRWFQFAIELKETGALVGDCALKVDAQDPRQAEIGFTLAPAHQGRGLGREAVRALLDHAFPAFGLHRVVATTDALNAPAAALLERLGFRREGHFIENIFFKGAWGSEFLYAVLAREWRASGGRDRDGAPRS